jgi:hypothetical protein
MCCLRDVHCNIYFESALASNPLEQIVRRADPNGRVAKCQNCVCQTIDGFLRFELGVRVRRLILTPGVIIEDVIDEADFHSNSEDPAIGEVEVSSWHRCISFFDAGQMVSVEAISQIVQSQAHRMEVCTGDAVADVRAK